MRLACNWTSVLGGILLVGSSTTIWAAPQISGVSGNLSHDQQVQISGVGFGQKSPAKPIIWAPFDDSLSPSSLGIKAAWDQVQGMVYSAAEGYGGGGGAKSLPMGWPVWTLRTDASGFAWNDFNQKMYLFRRTKQNFSVAASDNWKILRVWADNGSGGNGYPDWYIQAGNGGVVVESQHQAGTGAYPYGGFGDTTSTTTAQITAARGPTNAWKTEEILMKANSSLTTMDAQFYHYVLGYGLAAKIPYTDYETHTFWLKRTGDEGAMRRAYIVHGVMDANYPTSYTYWADDVYLDNTWARVMIGNAPKLSDCSQLDIQIPFEWTDNKIAITVNTKSIPDGQSRYLFVVDSSNSPSSGYLLGSAVVPSPPRDVIAE